MDELDLTLIRERLRGISQGDWVDDVDGDSGDLIVKMGDIHNAWFENVETSCSECHANARFVANAKTDIPALLEEVKRLRAEKATERERVLALLDKEVAEWKEDEQTFPNGVILDERVEGIVQAFQILRDLINDEQKD